MNDPTNHTDDEQIIHELGNENHALRRMLCLAHAGAGAYLDDGEIQDNTKHPAIDWKRDTLDKIKFKLHERARLAFKSDPMKSAKDNQEAHTEWSRDQNRKLNVPKGSDNG